MDSKLLENIQAFRKLTNLSIGECKTILINNELSLKKSLEYYSTEYKSALLKSNSSGGGVVFSYIHHNFKLGVLLHISCNTDFVSNNSLFHELAKNISVHIASANSRFLNMYSISHNLIQSKRRSTLVNLRNKVLSIKCLREAFKQSMTC
jgi:elongation factor Ts